MTAEATCGLFKRIYENLKNPSGMDDTHGLPTAVESSIEQDILTALQKQDVGVSSPTQELVSPSLPTTSDVDEKPPVTSPPPHQRT